MPDSSYEELRCFCGDNTLLAIIKRDANGKPLVHIKIYKARRIFGEIIFVLGEMEVRCRDCRRWHKIRIIRDNAIRSLSKRSRATRLNLGDSDEPAPDGLHDTAVRA